MLVGGETVYIPALYASFLNYLDFKWLFLTAFIATFLMDFVLFMLGKKIPLEKIISLSWLKKKTVRIEKYQKKFNQHAFLIFLFSKFFYGTRATAQLVYGLQKIPTSKYIFLNSLSIIIWLLVMYLIGLGVRTGLYNLHTNLKQIEFISAGIFLIFMIGFIWILRMKTKKELSQ